VPSPSMGHKEVWPSRNCNLCQGHGGDRALPGTARAQCLVWWLFGRVIAILDTFMGNHDYIDQSLLIGSLFICAEAEEKETLRFIRFPVKNSSKKNANEMNKNTTNMVLLYKTLSHIVCQCKVQNGPPKSLSCS
jgi:hypothetical protein